jgi:DNA-binding beta-propeller fold protein YncE
VCGRIARWLGLTLVTLCSMVGCDTARTSNLSMFAQSKYERVAGQRAEQLLYVANVYDDSVTEYQIDGSSPSLEISQSEPLRLALHAKSLFVATDTNPGLVGVYDAATGKSQKRITDHIDGPRGLAFGGDDLYVANSSGSGNYVSIYQPPRWKLAGTFDNSTNGLSTIASDAKGNLYAAHTRYINVYAPGGTRLLRTISEGVSCPNALAFDDAGFLYVANFIGNVSFCSGKVVIYAPGKTKAHATLFNGLDGPVAMAFDGAQNLYVANQVNGTVSEFAPSKRRPFLIRKLFGSNSNPEAIAVTSAGELFAGFDNGIAVFDSGQKKPSRIITDGIEGPAAILLEPGRP